MKPATLIGILLIVAGAAGLALGTFSYQEEKTVFKLGDLEARTKEDKTVPLKLAGGLALAAGVVLVVVGGRKR
jgi:hypothetical protein